MLAAMIACYTLGFLTGSLGLLIVLFYYVNRKD